MCTNPEPVLYVGRPLEAGRTAVAEPDSGVVPVSRFYHPGVVQPLFPCVLPCMRILSACYVLGQFQRELLQMAGSLGPISSSVRVVSGQAVSGAHPALPVGGGPG